MRRMVVRHFAVQMIGNAAIRAFYAAVGPDWQKHARMPVPSLRVRRLAVTVQRQIFRRDGDVSVFIAVHVPVSRVVCRTRYCTAKQASLFDRCAPLCHNQPTFHIFVQPLSMKLHGWIFCGAEMPPPRSGGDVFIIGRAFPALFRQPENKKTQNFYQTKI